MAVIRNVSIVLCCLVLLVGFTAGAVPGVGATGALSDVEPGAETDDDRTGPLGSQISSFMQTSTAELDGSVESGMWRASAGEADDVDRRATGLERRLERIERRHAELETERENDEISGLEYQARASRLLGQYLAVQAALSDASEVARGIGASPEALDRVRERSARTGPAMSGVARGLPGGVPPGLADDDREGPPGQSGDRPDGGPPGSDDDGDDEDSSSPTRPGGGQPDPDERGDGRPDEPDGGS